MQTVEVPTYEVKIYIGSREGYHGLEFSRDELQQQIATFHDDLPRDDLVSVRITPCLFAVGNWSEAGWEIAAINYPRFPKQEAQLNAFAISLAKFLLLRLKQNRITVVQPSVTTMIENDQAEQHR